MSFRLRDTFRARYFTPLQWFRPSWLLSDLSERHMIMLYRNREEGERTKKSIQDVSQYITTTICLNTPLLYCSTKGFPSPRRLTRGNKWTNADGYSRTVTIAMSLFLLHQQSSMWKLVSFDWLDRSLRWGLVSLRQIHDVLGQTNSGRRGPRLHYSQGFRGLEQSSNGPLDSNTLQQSMKKATSKISTHKIITARFKQAPHMREPKVNERLAKDRKRWKKPLFLDTHF